MAVNLDCVVGVEASGRRVRGNPGVGDTDRGNEKCMCQEEDSTAHADTQTVDPALEVRGSRREGKGMVRADGGWHAEGVHRAGEY